MAGDSKAMYPSKMQAPKAKNILNKCGKASSLAAAGTSIACE